MHPCPLLWLRLVWPVFFLWISIKAHLFHGVCSNNWFVCNSNGLCVCFPCDACVFRAQINVYLLTLVNVGHKMWHYF